MPTPQARRDRVFAIYAPLLLKPLARQVKRNAPASVDVDDLVGAGTLALLEVADRLEGYARARAKGAMIDSMKEGRRYWVAKYRPTSEQSLTNVRDCSQSPEAIAIERIDGARRIRSVKAAIIALPAPARKAVASRLRGEHVIAFAKRAGVSERTAIRRGVDAVSRLRAAFAA